MRFLTIVAIWGLATAAALVVAAETKVGAVVFTVSTRHGVHKGDLVAFAIAYAWATVLSLGVFGAPRR